MEARAEGDVVEAGQGGRAVDDAGAGVDGSEGADGDGHHRGPVLRGRFADLAENGGDDLIGAAGPGGGDGSAGQHLPGGVEGGGAGLAGHAEVDDDVDVDVVRGLGRALGWSIDTVTLCSRWAKEDVYAVSMLAAKRPESSFILGSVCWWGRRGWC